MFSTSHRNSHMAARISQILLILFIHFWFSTAQTDDATFLRALKDAWDHTPPNWDENSDPCSGWDGITCTNSRVTSITLASMGLTGSLTGDIGQLTELQILDLSYNKGLTGSLTPAIGSLKKLTNLILVNCGFSGPLPDTLGNLENIIFMSLNSNGFTGGIPPSIGNLRNLYWLDLADNKLTGGIPVSSGTTPGLDMLIHTKHFHFGGNMLSGPIPSRLFNSNMTLIHFLFENNQLRGPIPETLGLVKSLEVIRLDRNLLTGDVPSNLNNLTGVVEMFLSNNQLTGLVPNLTGLNSLNYLDLGNNTFDPSRVPSWFSTLQSLTTLKMYSTNLVGQLPVALFSIPQLQNVDLSNNGLNGTLNIGSSHSNQLQQVNLQNNQIGDFTQRNQYTIDLILVGNPICTETGITDKFCSLPTNTSSSYLTPPNNCVPTPCSSSGQVSSPNCICAYPYTGNLFFRAPSFSDLGNSTVYDSLRNAMINSFRRSQLPVDSVSLRNPTKNIDDYLVINLLVFPSGDDRFNRTGILGLGFSLSNQTFKPPAAFGPYFFIGENYDFLQGASGGGKKSSNTGVIVGSAVGGCVLVALLVVAGMYILRKRGRTENATRESSPFALWDATGASGAVPQLKGAKAFSFEELNKYTNNFAESNNIGTGGYGTVYRGSLPNGQLIAIKRSKQGSTQGGLEFKTEIELLSRVHHKNLVSLVGFCFDQGEQMLVYEYIVNGTVKDSLSGRSGIRLDWIRRLRIALGAAKGLQYLHDLADPPIIHRDVKTNNILLDERLVAKVADFGLSKSLGDANRTHVTTQVKGTMGYMDPEYYMTQQLTEKSDVYSFGVVLLELITARNPIEKGKYIVREVKQAMDTSKELYNLHDVLDPTIGLNSQLKGLERFVDVALQCVEERGDRRPTMSDVVKEIESIMELVGLNPNAESASNSTDYPSKGSEHPYTNDSLFAYSGDHFSTKLDPK
ncbi:leucine-rich repeat receptor protein kinase HPCA1-like [Bidens hawaiensis]|uniref:leucine-rich repeat receptor protein kinase HPCA1-like n=1 Tax=Bidens hawaiensis TaxID=980011 RepID=UPI00404A54BE